MVMRTIVIVGIPVVTLCLFILYWFVLCPIIWEHGKKNDDPDHAWNSFGVYQYWVVAAGVWTVVVFLIVYCCKKEDQFSREKDIDGSSKHLLSPKDKTSVQKYTTSTPKHNKTSVPFNVTPIPVQPKGEKEEIAPYQWPLAGMDIAHVHVQPSTLRTMPTSRPSENEFMWDHESVPWLTGNTETLTEELAVENIPQEDLEIDFEITSPKRKNSQFSENGDQSQDFGFLGIECRSDFYQITPTGSIHSSSEDLSLPIENQTILETGNSLNETEKFNETK